MKIGKPDQTVRLLLWKQEAWVSEPAFAAKANGRGERNPRPAAIVYKVLFLNSPQVPQDAPGQQKSQQYPSQSSGGFGAPPLEPKQDKNPGRRRRQAPVIGGKEAPVKQSQAQVGNAAAGAAQPRDPPEEAGDPNSQGDQRIAIEKAGAEKARAGQERFIPPHTR